MSKRPARAVYASLLLAAALAALLVAWFVSGWAHVRAQQEELAAQPERAAERKAVELAHDLRGQLQRLLAREIERKYYEYGNLFHDPRAGDNVGVAPSPLASGPEDSLVLGYFQIDPAGRVSTPTVNDEVPELSEPKNLAANRAFRDEVVRALAGVLRSPRDGALVARTDQRQAVLNIDSSSYVQNWNSNGIYVQQNARGAVAPPPNRGHQVPVTHSALEWRTYLFAGAPTLIAVRNVDTPDGALVQGFVVDRTTVTSWLAGRAGDSVAELRTGDDLEAPEIAPGWHLAVTANPQTRATYAADASDVARDFVVRFVVIGVLAALVFGFVVILVARAERLASERSQFAAAAAHELRTPLAGLQLYGDMLADGLGDPAKARDYARRMSEEASRLGRVVSNVLGFSQLERGNLSVDVRPDDLGTALAELAERAQPALDRAGAALEVDVPHDLRANFDRDALARIVGNLLDNAEKYSRESDDRMIALAARSVDDRVEIVISDHGPGVTEQATAQLFRPFVRGVTADGPAGLGLGLALSQSLARAMGGDLEYRPGVRDGAAFVVRLVPARGG